MRNIEHEKEFKSIRVLCGDGTVASMAFDIRAGRHIDQGTVVRAYSPTGLYWRESLKLPNALYLNEGDLIFTACHFDESPHKEGYSEYDQPMIDELRLLAALALPIGREGGMLTLYPQWASVSWAATDNLAEPEMVQRLSQIVREELKPSDGRYSTDGPSPAAFGGRPYTYRESPAPLGLRERIFQEINVSDHLLMRGLSALLKSAMLQQHRVFGEQAHYSLYVALDSSLQLILKMLTAMGVANASAVDALAFVEEAFGQERSGRRYFDGYYDDRIMTFHPQSRLGVVPYAPIYNSIFYSLYYDLRDIYRWLILKDDYRL